MKKIILCSIALMMILINSAIVVNAVAEPPTDVTINDNEVAYIETVIEVLEDNMLTRATSSKTGRKTDYYKNAAGQTLWYVQVEGTFTYNDSTSTCTNSNVTAQSNVTLWKISSSSASKSGNKATAKCYNDFGIVISTVSRSVTLTCSPNGTLS